MLQKVKHLYHSSKKEFFYYALVGCSAFVLDLISLVLLKELLKFTPVEAVILNQALILNYVFFLNKKISFKSSGQTLKRAKRFYILSAWNYLFTVVWMYVLTTHWHFYYLFVRVAGILIQVCWNFFLYKFWVYKKE